MCTRTLETNETRVLGWFDEVFKQIEHLKKNHTIERFFWVLFTQIPIR